MNRGKIEILQRTDGSVAINVKTGDGGDVWVTHHEIADIFQIFISAVNANLRVIFKNEELYESEVTKEIDNVTLYNLEVVIALAFRCKGPICRQFRQWLREQAKRPILEHQPLIIQISKETYLA